MIPTKSRDLIPETAAAIGIPEEDLSCMLLSYFKENKRIASTLQANHIVLKGLGTLSIQGWLLKGKIEESTNPENLPLLSDALLRWDEETKLKREKAVIKKQFYDNKIKNDESQIKGTAPDSLEK